MKCIFMRNAITAGANTILQSQAMSLLCFKKTRTADNAIRTVKTKSNADIGTLTLHGVLYEAVSVSSMVP
jgi:hypothetical protein